MKICECNCPDFTFSHRGDGTVWATCKGCGFGMPLVGKTVWNTCTCGGALVAQRGESGRRLTCQLCGHCTPLVAGPAPEGTCLEVVCLDNTGIEEQFDIGVSYICERGPDERLLSAYDRSGSPREVFSSRFDMSSAIVS